MKLIFTATSGRSGTGSLARIVNNYAFDAVCEHEPPDLLLRQLRRYKWISKRGWFGNGSRIADLGHKFQRKYIVTDEMLGRGKTLKWYGEGDLDKLGAVVEKRLRRLKAFEARGYKTYIESSHFFIRHFAEETAKRASSFGLIKLTRDPLENAKSLANRKRSLFRHALTPDHQKNIFQVTDYERLSDFQIFLIQWIEQQLRYHQFVESYNVEKIFSISTNELSDAEKVSEMLGYFAIAHKPLDDLRPQNTNAEINKPDTEISCTDVRQFNAVIDILPPALFDRIDYLQGYSPSAGE